MLKPLVSSTLSICSTKRERQATLGSDPTVTQGRTMCTLPPAIIQVLRHFELAFSDRVGHWAKILVIGAILAPGTRTVTATLRVMGLTHARQFPKYHRVLSRATWSSRRVSRILLHALVRAFVPVDTPIIIGLDDHIERRRGDKIAAKGSYR